MGSWTKARVEILKLKEYCFTNLKDKELWPSYYERRYLEFLNFLDLFPDRKIEHVLELGCGVGYYSAFLAKIADHVTATDLESIDPVTHSPGLQITRDILKSLDVNNVTVMNASAESLPFPDNSFDMVFSSHVLEHVPDVNKAVSEINRVLRPGGINICIVPTTTDRIYALAYFYMYLLKRTVIKLFNLVFPAPKSVAMQGHASAEKSIAAAANAYLKYFPFPEPHGVLQSYTQELKHWTLSNWRRIITGSGRIKLVSQRGLQLNPVLPLSGVFFPIAGVKIYRLTRRVENKLSGLPVFKQLGLSTMVITEKQ